MFDDLEVTRVRLDGSPSSHFMHSPDLKKIIEKKGGSPYALLYCRKDNKVEQSDSNDNWKAEPVDKRCTSNSNDEIGQSDCDKYCKLTQNESQEEKHVSKVPKTYNGSVDSLYPDIGRIFSDTAWLNDDVVIRYLWCITRDVDDVAMVDSGCYSQLCKGTGEFDKLIQRSTIFGTSIYSKDLRLLLIPIHLTDHWVLGIIHFKERWYGLYDSLPGDQENALSNLKNLVDYFGIKSNDNSRFEDRGRIDGPKQKNGHDCGVYMLIAARYFVQLNSLDAFKNNKDGNMLSYRIEIRQKFRN